MLNINSMKHDDLFSFYSDFHKDVIGVRPRHYSHLTKREMLVEIRSLENMKAIESEWDEYELSLIPADNRWDKFRAMELPDAFEAIAESLGF